MQVLADINGVNHENKPYLKLAFWPRICPDDLHCSAHRLLWAFCSNCRWKRCSAQTTRRGFGRLQNPEQWTGLQLFVSARNRERNVLGTRGQTAGLQAKRCSRRESKWTKTISTRKPSMLFKYNFCMAISTATLMSLTACGGGSATITTNIATYVETRVADKSPAIDTSQADAYDATSVITAPTVGQAFYGQDAHFAGTQPSYTKSSDGLTVKDNVTGLTWQASQTGGDVYWTEAETVPAALNKASYGGYSDWRLPTIRELYSLWNGSTGWPYIDKNYFSVPAITETELSHAIMWSSTKYTGLLRSSIEGNVGAEMAFGVNFGTGHIKAYSAAIGPKHMVRAVRGPIYGTSSFVDNGNGTINDQATGLMWTQSDSGAGMDWEQALAWAQTKNGERLLGYSDWRLPNSKELQSLVDYTRSAEATSSASIGPAISPLFKISSITNEAGATDYPYFWTNTSAKANPTAAFNSAWYVAFGRATDASGKDLHGAGAVRFDAKVMGKAPGQDAERVFNYVRLVRDIL